MRVLSWYVVCDARRRGVVVVAKEFARGDG